MRWWIDNFVAVLQHALSGRIGNLSAGHRKCCIRYALVTIILVVGNYAIIQDTDQRRAPAPQQRDAPRQESQRPAAAADARDAGPSWLEYEKNPMYRSSSRG